MPGRPDFYCDFYCAAWDGLRWSGTGGHEPRGRAGRIRSAIPPVGPASARSAGRSARSSGSCRGLQRSMQRLVPVGRPGTSRRSCQVSPTGSVRRGR
jgi:hypothetical protein